MGQIGAVAEMHPLQAALATAVLDRNQVAVPVPAQPGAAVRIGQGHHAGIRNVGTLDKPDPLELGKPGELCNRVIGQIGAAAKVDVADPVAERDQALDSIVGDERAVAQVEEVEIPAEAGDGIDGRVGEVAALL